MLVNLYSDKVLKEALYEKEFNDELMITIRYADDTAIIYDDLQVLQNLINSVGAVG